MKTGVKHMAAPIEFVMSEGSRTKASWGPAACEETPKKSELTKSREAANANEMNS